MKVLFQSIITIVFLYTLYRAVVLQIGVTTSIRWLQKKQKEFQSTFRKITVDDPPFLILLLPVLREERELPGLLQHLSAVKYPANKIQIVVITTEKEEFEAKSLDGQNRQSTISVAKEMVENKNLELGKQIFLHFHYPQIVGKKADQLNFALQEIDRLYLAPSADKTFIGVYDADSRPDVRTFEFIAWDVANSIQQKETMPQAYQQIPLYFKNFHTLARTFEGWLLRLEALYQTRWALGYEIPNYRSQTLLLNSSLRVSSFWNSRLCYLIGHGCFLRLDIIRQVGSFPTYSPAEDLTLGNILSLLGIPIKTIPFFDLCEVPESLSILFHQSRVWFATSMTIFETIHRLQTSLKSRASETRAFYLALQRSIMHVSWAFGGIIFISCLLGSILIDARAKIFLGLGVISGLTYTTVGIFTVIRSFRILDKLLLGVSHREWEISPADFLSFLVLSPLKAITNCIGPVVYFCYSLWSRITLSSQAYKKTERSVSNTR